MIATALPLAQGMVPGAVEHAGPILRPTQRLLGGFAAVAAIGFLLGPLTYDGAVLNWIWLGLVVLVLAARWTRRAGAAMAADFTELFALFAALSLAGSLVSALLAAAGRPLIDPALARIDTLLGFAWPNAMTWLIARPGWLEALSAAYSTLSVQPVLLIGIACASGQSARAARFVHAWGITLALTLLISPFTPAVGNFIARGIAPAAVPGVQVPAIWEFMAVFGPVRDGSLTRIGFEQLTGLITFPSFHAAGAVLLAWGGWTLRGLRVPLLLLNAAMLVATVFVGGHYLIDVAAGAALAGVAVLVTRQAFRTDARSPSPRSARSAAPAPR